MCVCVCVCVRVCVVSSIVAPLPLCEVVVSVTTAVWRVRVRCVHYTQWVNSATYLLCVFIH